MKKGLREIIIIFLTTALALGSIGYLTAKQITNYVTTFAASGYILDTSDSSNGALVNQQYYFNQGEAYSAKKSSDKVSFNTVNGDPVSVDPACFIHYSDSSMSSFAKTVVLDTDNMNPDNISYYSVSKETLLQRQGDSYIINSAVNPLQLKNFIWKITESQYMVVSETITLHVDENSYQRFNDYIQVQYKESGVAYIVNQEGTYSTVSSDAYLELANGIRIYLGSKNISDSEGILLSLAQIIVNSEDNIEIIPDEEFKKEKDVEPKIVVEANDGADGEMGAAGQQGGSGNDGSSGAAGEAGISGEDGEGGADGVMGSDGAQGKTGATGQAGAPGVTGITGRAGKAGKGGTPGTEGDPGTDGASSETAGVIYVENEDPEYHVSIVPSTYGIKATVTYDLNGCIQNNVQMESTYVYIQNSETGKIVWRKDDIGAAWTPSGTEITCDTLSADTNYIFGISACYTNVLNEDIVGDEVLTQLFATESIGIKLKSRYVTDNVIAVDLDKNVENNIKSITGVVTDSNGNFVGYLEPTNSNSDYNLHIGFDENDPTTFDIDQLPIGTTIPLAIANLNPDTTYKIQIKLVTYTDESQLVVSPSDANACPLMTQKTLRTPPTLGKPDVTVSHISKSFIIAPKDIVDPYNGIISYTYDIYNASAVSASSGSNLSFNENPVLSVTSDNAKSIKVKVDESTIVSGKNYVVRVVAHFNNNSAVLDYSSPLSDIFSYNPNLSWPSGANTVTNVTASTLEGKVVITDTNGTAIPREETDYLTVCIAPVLQEIKNNGSTWGAGEMVELTRISTNNFADNKITIPYEAIGLKNNTRYTIYVTSSRLTTDDGTETDVVLFTENVATTIYEPISMNIHHETPVGDELFAEYIRFYAPNKTKEDGNAQKTSSIWGNMSHISGKALGYVEFQLYAGDLDNCTLIGSTRRYADDYNSGIGYDLRRNTYTFDYDITVSDGVNTTVYNAYAPDNATAGTLDGFKLTAADFGDPVNDDKYASYFQNLSSKFVIKAKVYDYTYGKETTGGKSLWRDSNVGPFYNPIPSGKKVDNTYNYEFVAEFTLTAAFPSWTVVKQKANFAELTYKNLGSDTASEVTLYKKLKGLVQDETVNSNYPTVAGEITAIDTIYHGKLKDTTSIGVRYSGPSNGLAGAAAKVQYSIYSDVTGYTEDATTKTGSCTDVDPTKLLAQSEWLEVSGNKLPDYYFLVDASLGRGSNFYVVTSVELATGYGGNVYPDAYYAVNRQAATPEERPGINDNGKDVDGLLCTKFCLKNQAPTVKLVQDTGNAGGSVTYMFSFSDFDKAFVGSDAYDGTNGEELYFYTNTNFNKNFIGTRSAISASENISASYTSNAKTTFPYLITSVPTSTVWGLKWTETDYDTEYQLVQLDQFASVLESKGQVTILDENTDPAVKTALNAVNIPNTGLNESLGLTAYFGDSPTNQEGRVLTIQYYFFAAEKTDFLTSDIHFHWANATDTIDYTMNKNLSEYTEVSDNPTYITVNSKTYSIYKAKIVLDLLDYPDLVSLPGKSGISVSVKIYSETGKFGLGYVKSGSYFTIQMKGVADKRYRPEGSLFAEATPGSKDAIFLGGYDLSDGNIPGCYQFMITNDVAKYYYIDDGLYKAMESTYSTEGLLYIPREVKMYTCTKADISAPNGPVVNMKVEVIPGYSSAVMNFTVDKTNTNVDFTNNVRVFYAELTNPNVDPLAGDYDTLTGKAAQLNPTVFVATTADLQDFTLSGSLYKYSMAIPVTSGKSLKPNTTYVFKVFVDTDKTSGETYQYNKLKDTTHPKAEQFKTIERVEATVTNLDFWADAEGNKTATVSYKLDNVQWSFFDDSATNQYKVLEAAYLVIRQDSNPGGLAYVVAGSDTESILGDIRQAYPDASKQAGVKTSFTLEKTLDWSPSMSHIMDNSTDYYAELMLVYVGGHVDASTKTQPYLTLLNGQTVTDPTAYSQLMHYYANVPSWDHLGGMNSTYLSVVPSASYDYDLNTPVLTFSVSGRDNMHIFNRNGSDVSYTITLLEDNVAVPNSGITISKNVDASGAIAPVLSDVYKFTGLAPSTNKYRLLVTCTWDNNNDGIWETNSAAYAYSTGNITIPDKNVVVNGVYLNPNVGNQAVVMGTNLAEVTSVSYQLYENSNPVPIESTTLNVSSGHSRWTTDPNSPGSYNLKLLSGLNPASTYQLDMVIEATNHGLNDRVVISQWWRPTASTGVVTTQSKGNLFNQVVGKITDFFRN